VETHCPLLAGVSPHPSLVATTRYSNGGTYPIPPSIGENLYPACFPIAECNPLSPLGFRFDPDEIMTLRNDREGVYADRTILVAWLMRPEFNDTGGVIQFISLFYFL